LLESKKDSQNNNTGNYATNSNSDNYSKNNNGQAFNDSGDTIDISDDDLSF